MNILEITKKLNLRKDILKGRFGLEKESLRVDSNGRLALTPHPEIFGDKSHHKFITVDFSESQLELITPPLNSVKDTYNFLQNIHEVVIKNIGDEYLWNQSNPCSIPSVKDIPIAKFPNDKSLEIYRENLGEKYGREKQLISGIHFNFSMSDEVLAKLYKESGSTKSFKEFKNDIYFKIARNYFRYGWIIIYLLGASPIVHNSYNNCCSDTMDKFTNDSLYFENSLSFRNGPCGYKNKEEFTVNYKSLDSYIKNIETLVEEGILQGAKEYYSPIRVKSTEKDLLKGLKEKGVEYLEIRSIDINPFNSIGLEKNDLEFIHLLLIYFAMIEDRDFTDKDYSTYMKNLETLAKFGRDKDFTLICCEDSLVSPKEYTYHLLGEIEAMMKDIGILSDYYKEVLNFQKEKLEEGNLYTEKLLKEVKEKGYLDFHMDIAKSYKKTLEEKEYTFKGYEDLELSTQILLKECLLQGINFEILDRQENFIRLEKNGKIEYVKQATKTSLDSYITMLIMENKVVTKKVLAENNIKVPLGKDYDNIEDAHDDFDLYKGREIVIKPKSTNFGLGITIFKEKFSREDYDRALNLAFKEDTSVLIEEFIHGKEYRFLVIGDEVVGILHRVPANVKGDGILSIKDLVEIKNQDTLRGKGYKTPLEKIKLGDAEEMFLAQQGLDINYIPKLDEIIYLRENSNISTGGDSLDFTDDINNIYKEIAIKASKAAGATICGVDVMLRDIKNPNPDGNYAIIEINFNPAIHIHSYPYKGKRRKIARKLLKTLGY